jgi:hypothetical protein
MIKNSKNISIKKLKKMLKTELATVFVTTSNKRFLNLNEALECELELEKKRLIIKKKEKLIMKIYEILSKILSENEWGIFFKGEPIEGFPTQDGMRVYRVNEITTDRLYDAIDNELKQMENECQKNPKETPTDGESSNG